MRWIALVVMFAFCACEPVDHCLVNDTRCSGAVAEVCGSDERWTEIMNCDEVAAQSGGQWSCQSLEKDAGHTCLPVVEDGGVDGGEQ